MEAEKLREGFLQGASWILTSAPSIGTQFLEKKTNKVIIILRYSQREPSLPSACITNEESELEGEKW